MTLVWQKKACTRKKPLRHSEECFSQSRRLSVWRSGWKFAEVGVWSLKDQQILLNSSETQFRKGKSRVLSNWFCFSVYRAVASLTNFSTGCVNIEIFNHTNLQNDVSVKGSEISLQIIFDPEIKRRIWCYLKWLWVLWKTL